MVLVSYIHVLSAAFLMGLAAAAPMGPVNMLAIRRGVIGGWRHTLACGIGSVTGDLILFSLVLLGGALLSFLTCPTRAPDCPGGHRRHRPASAGDLLPCPRRQGSPAGLRKRSPPLERRHRPRASDRRSRRRCRADHLQSLNHCLLGLRDLQLASLRPFGLGYSAPGLGILMATAGLMTWFTALTVLVRFIPHRIGPNFFRLVNAILGLILLGFATFCAIVLSRLFPR